MTAGMYHTNTKSRDVVERNSLTVGMCKEPVQLLTLCRHALLPHGRQVRQQLAQQLPADGGANQQLGLRDMNTTKRVVEYVRDTNTSDVHTMSRNEECHQLSQCWLRLRPAGVVAYGRSLHLADAPKAPCRRPVGASGGTLSSDCTPGVLPLAP